MECKRITRENDPFFERVFDLCREAFPREERRDMDQLRRVLKREDYHMNALVEGDALLGVLCYWQGDWGIFLEHLATAPQLRNRGLGSYALGLLRQKGLPVFLEIEPPVDSLTRRRYGFYCRNGFVMNPFDHIQAQYRPGDPPVHLKILSFPGPLPEESYRAFLSFMDRYIGWKPE